MLVKDPKFTWTGTMIFDLHTHTERYSDCSFINPEELIRQAAGADLDGIAITEHGMRWPDAAFDKLKLLAGRLKLVLINGQEIYTADQNNKMEGEFLVFGVGRSLTGKYTARELIDTVRADNGVIIAAHPFKLSRNGRTHYYGAGELIHKLDLDAVELHHPDHDERALKKVREAMEARGLPGTGGSDAHKIFSLGSNVTVFENPIRDERDFIREIRSGRFHSERRFEDLDLRV